MSLLLLVVVEMFTAFVGRKAMAITSLKWRVGMMTTVVMMVVVILTVTTLDEATTLRLMTTTTKMNMTL